MTIANERPDSLNIRGMRVGVCMLALALLAGCGKEQKTDDLYAEALALYDRHEYKGAAIHLRNVLEANPFHRESQLLIGQIYLELNDPKSAEKELRKARQLNVEPVRYVAPLARAFLLSNEPARILDEIRIAPEMSVESVAAVHVAHGNAHLVLKKPKEAQISFAAALKLQPEYADALLGQARLSATAGNLGAALSMVEHALSKAPTSADGWEIKGDLLRASARHEEAAKAYSEALALRPFRFSVLLSRAFALVEVAQYDTAQIDINEALKRDPRHPLANYLQALTEFRQGNYPRARDHLAQTLKSAPDYMPAVLVSGAVELALGSTQRAENELARVVRYSSGDTYARKLLAFTYVRMNQPKRALEVIAPALEGNPRDPVLLGLAGEIYMRSGQYARAGELMQQAVAIDPKRAELYKGLGMLRVAQGDAKAAVGEFKHASALDPSGRHGDFLLAVTLLNNKRFDEALAVTRELVKKQPKNPVAPQLAGAAYLGKEDKAAARTSFEQALVLAPAYFPAAMALARLDVERGNHAAARRRLESVLAHDPRNWQAMMALANLAGRQNNEKEAVDWLERARKADDKVFPPRLLLARHYLEVGAPHTSLVVALEAEQANPDSPEALEALGLAQLATGEASNALASFQKLVARAPKSAPALLRLASAQMAAGKAVDADQAVRKALELAPDSVEAKEALGQVQLRLNRYREAQKTAHDLQAQHPKRPTGYALEGEVFLVQKRSADAAVAFERAFEAANDSTFLKSVYAAHASGGNTAKGEQRLLDWLARNPNDLAIRSFLGDAYLISRRNVQAAEQYEAILTRAPDNVVVLNNLASAYLKSGDQRALATAQRAHRLKPEHPAILDTLGWVLAQGGDAKRAVPYLEQAAKAAPKSAEIRYHLSVALVKSGDRERGRQIAKELMESGARLPAGEDPSKLLE